MSTTKAIIEAGAKQYLVHEGMVLEVELVDGKGPLSFEPLLVISGSDKIEVGTPSVKNVSVKAELVEEVKGEKIVVFKFRPKKRYKRKTGHRQRYSRIKITSIG